MKKMKMFLLLIAMLSAFTLTACSGGDSDSGSGSGDSGSGSGSGDSGGGGGGGGGTASASLKFKVLDLSKAVSSTAPSFITPFDGTGDSGSSMEGFKVRVEKLELKKSDSTYVTVYSGNEYLETIGTGSGSFAGILNGTMPDTGTYTGYRLTTNAFKIKLKIVSGATTYYTTNQSISQGSVWTLSTSSASYDYITITQGTSETITGDFPTSLSVTANNDVNLVWALKRSGAVLWEGTDLNNVTWAAEGDIVRAILPNTPSKLIQFNLTTTGPSLSNTISTLLDSSGSLLGGFCYRPTNKAINGGFLKSGSLSAVSNSGNTATFNVSFADGDNNNNYYQITGSYDCGASTSGTYSSLSVTGVGATPYYSTAGATLTTSGAITCSNITTTSP